MNESQICFKFQKHPRYSNNGEDKYFSWAVHIDNSGKNSSISPIQMKVRGSVSNMDKTYKLNSVHWKMIRTFSVNTISFGRWKTRVMGVWNQIIIWRRWIEWRTTMDWKHIRSKIVDCCDFSSFDVITYILWVDPDTFESLTESWPYI